MSHFDVALHQNSISPHQETAAAGHLCICEECGTAFEGTSCAHFCPTCRIYRRTKARRKYVWSPEQDRVLKERYDGTQKGRVLELAHTIGFPGWEIKRRAALLGLTYSQDRRPWTAEEEAFLLEHAGSWLRPRLAKKLNRSLTSVVMKCKHLHLRTRFREGYTLRDLEECFGCDHHLIRRWVDEGKLHIRRRGTNRPHDAWYVTEQDILEFISTHPLAFRLSKVDQTWFLDLLLEGAIFKRALDAARRHDDPLRAA